MAAPPTFLQSIPPETDATDGDIVTFQVKLSNDPDDPTSVSWWRCGESLRPSPGKRDIIDHGDGWHELVLSNITDEDEGEYECRAENNRGHSSCFGSLYHYREGRTGTLTDVTAEGEPRESDGRRSGLLILIDDGSQTEESGSEKSNRKSMTVSEQMQGIIEDLTQTSQDTGSVTLEKDDDDQFDSDIDDLDNPFIQNILGMTGGHKTASQDTLIPEMPSPDPPVDVAVSEGASDPYGAPSKQPQKWSSNPNNVQRRKSKEPKEEVIWPPEASSLVTFDVADTATTTSTELPFARATSTEEGEAVKSSTRCAGAETPFDVADITEEAVDAESSLRCLSTEGATTERISALSRFAPSCGPASQADPPSGIRLDSSLTSVTDISVPAEGFKMSFVKSTVTYKQQVDDGVTTSSVTSHVSSSAMMDSSSVAVHHVSTKVSRTSDELEEQEESSFAAKKTRMSSAYEAGESTLYSESYWTDVPSDHKGIDVYVAIMDFRPMESDEEAVAMKEGQQVEVIDASKPRRWLVRVLPLTADDEAREGWVPACYLEKYVAFDTLEVMDTDLDPKELEAIQNREAIVKELVETEEDFAKDMQFVVDNYYKQMDNPRLPNDFRDRKGSIFGNFKDISDFHNNVLMEGIHYHAKEPAKLGKTFLRLERDFDMHASYCWNEARAQKLLKEEGALKDYFDEHSRTIDDDKLLADHLKLPIQRLNDYQLLLKELIKYSSRLGEDTADLQRALDFIHGINKRNRDLQTLLSMEGCRGDLLKVGKIIRQELFDVIEGDGGASERHVFLFKGRVFVTEKTPKETYHVTNLFKLQDVEVIEEVEGDPTAILFRSHKRSRLGFPLTLRARSLDQKTKWCRDIAAGNQVVEDLGELEPSLELKHKAEELEEPESKKPKFETLKRQDPEKEKADDSVPQTPTEEEIRPRLSRQESTKDKPNSTPQTPTGSDKSPNLSRQGSVKKEPKSVETSLPQTPVEESTAPTLERQESVKKKSKSAESSLPQTPEQETAAPTLRRQKSVKKKTESAEASLPQTPEQEKIAPTLERQKSVKKKSESVEASLPQTPVQETAAPTLERQESVKEKTKSAETSLPQTPEQETAAPILERQESVKKKSKSAEIPEQGTTAPSLERQKSVKKKSESSLPQTPESKTTAPTLERQESVKKKSKSAETSLPQTPELETTAPTLERQESVGKKSPPTPAEEATEKSKKAAIEEARKKKPKKGEANTIPKITMSEDASGSDARLDSVDFNNEDNATLASESLRSDDSITPPASGAYAKPSLPLPSIYRHLLILIPILCAFYVLSEILVWS